MKRIVWCFLLGTLYGLGVGIWNWHAGGYQFIEFTTIPAVTRTILYATTIGLLLLGVIMDPKAPFSTPSKWFFLGCTLFFIICMVVMGRRSCSVGLFLSFGFLFYHFPKNKRLIGFFAIVIIAVILSVVVISSRTDQTPNQLHMVHFKEMFHLLKNEKGVSDQRRLEVWKLGLAQATQGAHLFWGVGPFQFKNIRVETLNIKPPPSLEAGKSKFQHAHNLFLNKWCEEGLVGLTLFILFIIALLKKGRAYIRSHLEEDWIWIASMGALVNYIGVGMFDTPFYGETAWLAMILLGMGMQRTRTYFEHERSGLIKRN